MLVNKSNGTTYLHHQLSSERAHPQIDRVFANNSNGTTHLQYHQLSSEGSHQPIDRMTLNKPNGNTYLHHQLSAEGEHPPIDRVFANNSNGTTHLQYHQLSSEGAHQPIDRMIVNKSNGTTYLQHQLSSEGVNGIQDFHHVTYQLPVNESNISQQTCSLSYQLPSTGINVNQNSNMLKQQPFISASQAENLPNHVLSRSEFRGKQIKYSPDERKKDKLFSIIRQGLIGIFSRYFTNGSRLIHNQKFPSQQIVGNQDSHALSYSPETEFNDNLELSAFDFRLYQNLSLKYSEKLYICVIGPPRCGKANLIRTFGRSRQIRISTNKPLSWVMEDVLIGYETALKIDIWCGEDLTSAADDIRCLCQSSKSALVLVFKVAQKSSLSTAREWIQFLQKDMDFNVPIILVGNTTCAYFSSTSKEFSKFWDGVKAKDEYDLAEFYQCSTKCVEDVEKIFVFAALKAFNRTL